MPTFELSGPDGGTYQIDAPDENSAVAAFSQFNGAAAPAPAVAPVGVNDLVRAGASGVPVVGGVLNKLNAATNAALAPALNRFFDPKDQLQEANFSDRMAHSMRDQVGADKKFETEHPVVDTVAKLGGGIASMVPVMAAAPVAFGLAGPMSTMVRNGALSGAALSGADAAVRGENVVNSAAVGGGLGMIMAPVGKGVGKVVASIADRVRPPVAVPQNVARVGDLEIPLSQSQVTGDAVASAEEQILSRGGRGDAAQRVGQGFRDTQDTAVMRARDDIGAALDPSGAVATTAPQDAAERVASELIAQETARSTAAARDVADVQSAGARFSHALDPAGQMRGPTAGDAAENLSEGFARARDAAKADYRGKYDATAAAPGDFSPGSAAGFRADVERGLQAAESPVSLDPTNTAKSLQALDVIDRRLNLAGPGAPKPVEPSAQKVAPQVAQDVADIRAQYGDDVANAYERQKSAAPAERPAAPAAPVAPAAPAPAAPQTQSLLEFIASKGGLGPDAELAAIGGQGHTVNVEGVGRRKLVRQGGWPLDYAREAAEEAGYLQGSRNGTSTVNDLLDAMDAEMRGQKRYPQGFEGHAGKREVAARSEREQHEYDAFTRGIEADLQAAGHGELGGDVKARAVKLMADEGATADDAVERAFRQLEQEDAAGALRAEIFPGDRAPAPAAAAAETKAAPEAPGSSFTMRDVEQVRKEISTLYGDARKAMLGGGSGSDVHALEHIRDQFDARVERMIADGAFSGDGPAVLKMQQEARASFSDYKQKFSRRGPGDEVGSAVEKILGRFSDTKATPDTIVRLAYGSTSAPGGQMPVQIAQRIEKIFGKESTEFATYKQGLFAHLTEGDDVVKTAGRIDEFLNGTKGKMLAHTVFSAPERISLMKYADKLRGIAPKANDPGAIGAAVRRITGADGAPPASANEVVNYLYGPGGKGAGRVSVPLASHLKTSLSPDGWSAVRQGMWEKLTNAGEGKIAFEAQALSQRLHEFLNESGSQLATVMYSDKELKLMRQLASVYQKMIPVKGTTNPSGTAPMLAKIASGARHTLLPLLGFSQGGVGGAAIALGLDKGLSAIGNAKAARSATSLFYGDQAKRAADPRFAKGLGLLSQGSAPTINQRTVR